MPKASVKFRKKQKLASAIITATMVAGSTVGVFANEAQGVKGEEAIDKDKVEVNDVIESGNEETAAKIERLIEELRAEKEWNEKAEGIVGQVNDLISYGGVSETQSGKYTALLNETVARLPRQN